MMVKTARSKAATGLDSGVRKFTLSCSRCRASKLKCDRKEPCVSGRHFLSMCIHILGSMLIFSDHRWSVSNVTSAIFVPKMSATQEPKGQRPSTKTRRPPNSEYILVVGLLWTISDLDDAYSIRDTPSNGDGEAEAEEAAQLLEQFVQGDPRPDTYLSALRGQVPPSVGPDFANPYWLSNDPKRHGEKLSLIREIVDAMPDKEMINHLYEVFLTRCQGPLMNVVHTPTFTKQAEQFSNCLSLGSVDSQVLAIANTATMESLGCYLLAVGQYTLYRRRLAHIVGLMLSSCLASLFILIRLYWDGLLHL